MQKVDINEKIETNQGMVAFCQASGKKKLQKLMETNPGTIAFCSKHNPKWHKLIRNWPKKPVCFGQKVSSQSKC